MIFAESLHNKSSVLRISVLIVDDDPVFCGVISQMLVNSKYRDPSVMEITVIAEKDPTKALSILKHQQNNIDLIITDYYMPSMNGLQLKRRITEEIGNLPVIVVSADADKEQESLSCGAMGFLPKPIQATDILKIYQLALTCKRNGKSTLGTASNHKAGDTGVSVPQQNKMLLEQANVLKIMKKFSSKADLRSLNSTNGSCLISTDGSRKNRKRKPNDGSEDGESPSQPSKKKKISWTDGLHDLFLQAIRHIGLDKAVPKKILAFMNVSYLTRENVASHLQKYRIFLRKVAEQGLMSIMSARGIDSMFRHTHIKEPYFNRYTPSTSWYDTSLNNRSFYSKPGQGFGQSRLLSTTREPPVHFNQMPYNHMNRSSTYETHHVGSGSNLMLPIQSNLSQANQPSQNEERISFFEPPVMANKIGQTSQVHGFGQRGPSANNNFNNNMMRSFGSFTPNQPGLGHFSYGMQSFLNNENTAYNPEPHANATTQPNPELPQLENLNVQSDLGKTSELSYNISNFQFDHNKQQQGEEASNKFELPSIFSAELNQFLSLGDNGDWTFVNINEGHSIGEISNTFSAPEMNHTFASPETNPPSFNTNPNENQEQGANPDISNLSFLDPQDLVDDDFMNSLFNSDMN